METLTGHKKPGRPKKKQPSASALGQITVHLPPELVSALDNELVPLGMRSRSELIREACSVYLEQRKEQVETVPLVLRMRGFSKEARQKAMAAAAAALGDYYQTDSEMLEWQATEGEDFFDDDGQVR